MKKTTRKPMTVLSIALLEVVEGGRTVEMYVEEVPAPSPRPVPRPPGEGPPPGEQAPS